MRQSRTQLPSAPHRSETTHPLTHHSSPSYSRSHLRKPPKEMQAQPPSARHNDSAELTLIKRRYQELEKSYNQLLELVRRKNVEHDRLKEEARKLREQRSKDEEQIQHLRCIIGLVKKKNTGTQVEEEEPQLDLWQTGSRLNKFEQSTIDDIKFRHHSAEKASRVQYRPQTPTKKEKKESVTVSRVNEPKNSTELGQFEKLRRGAKLSKKGQASPWQRLRFVANQFE